MNFLQKWNQQLNFIDRSTRLIDEGHSEEAIRVATSLRVMFHDTRTSTSIISHLGKRAGVMVLSSIGYKDTFGIPGSKPILYSPLMTTLGGPEHGRMRAPLSAASGKDWLPFQRWWEETIAISGPKVYSRKDLILCTADQDGGAHVDATPSQKTQHLKEGMFVAGKITPEGLQDATPMVDFHFPLLRQLAYEVLNSPDLTSIS